MTRSEQRASLKLEVKTGQITAQETARQLGISRQAFYKWERRALRVLLNALQDQPPGRPNGTTDPEKQQLKNPVEDLERKVRLCEQRDNLRGLGHRSPCQVYHDPARRIRLHGLSRQRIFREVFEQFWQYVETMPERNHHTFNAAWRLIVETWLRRQGWISVTEKSQTNVSTDSEPFFSQN